MSLEIYLFKAKRFKEGGVDVSAQEIHLIDRLFHSAKEWTSDLDELIVLTDCINGDIINFYKDEYIDRYCVLDVDKENAYQSLFENLYAWDGIQVVHEWVVENIQDGEDDYGYYELSRESALKLIDFCEYVIENKLYVALRPETKCENSSARCRDYEMEYLGTIEFCKEFKKIVKNIDFDTEMLVYSSYDWE